MVRKERVRAAAPSGAYAALGERIGSIPLSDPWPLSGLDPETAEGGTDVWETLGDRLDPGQDRPKIATDVELKEFHMRWGNDYAVARNPRDLLHYRLTPD